MSNADGPKFVPHELQPSRVDEPEVYSEKTGTKEPEVNVETETLADDPDMLPIIEVENLPSKWLPYPEGSTIRFRPYKLGETLQIVQSKGKGEALLSELVLRGVETSFGKGDLTLCDFMWLALLRKLSSFGDEQFTIEFKCSNEKCGAKNTFNFSIEQIEFNDLEIPKLPITAQMEDGTELVFSPLTVGGFLELSKKENPGDPSAMLAMACKNLEYDVAYRKIYDVTRPLDKMVLRQVDRHLEHGVRDVQRKCESCNKANRIAIDGPRVLIRPFRFEKQSVSDAIRFG